MAEEAPKPTRVVGCLLDVSGSMREALETGRADEPAIAPLLAVLSAAQLAQTEQRRDPRALLFVGLFGLNTNGVEGCPPVVDLCGVIDALVGGRPENDGKTGHELLIALANRKGLAHITHLYQIEA